MINRLTPSSLKEHAYLEGGVLKNPALSSAEEGVTGGVLRTSE